MKNKILFIVILGFIINTNAQKIEQLKVFDLEPNASTPFTIINSNFDQLKKELNFLFWKSAAYSICRRPTFYGKIYQTRDQQQIFPYHVKQLPTIGKVTLDANTFNTKYKIETFHPYFDLKKSESVYFSPKKDKILNGLEGVPGDKIKHNEREINSVFTDFPVPDKKNNQKIIFSIINNTVSYNEYEKVFKFDIHKGWKMEENNKVLHKLDIPDLKKYSPIHKQQNYLKNKFVIGWFKNKENKALYKLVFYNVENDKVVVKDFDFKVPRKLVSGYNFVFDKNLNPKGILAVFGYHKKGKKQRNIYPKNRFDFIYMDLNGNEIINTKIDYGTEKDYKKTFMPVFVTVKPSGDLLFLNSHKKSFVNYEIEVFSLNKQGQLKLNSTFSKSKDVFDKTIIYYYREISNAKPFKLKDYYVFEGIVADKIFDNNQKKYIDSYTGVYDIILNKNLEFVNVNMNFMQPGAKGKIIKKDFKDDKRVALFEKNNQVYIRDIILDNNKPDILFKYLKIVFDKETESNFFGRISLDNTYIDKDKKEIYLPKIFYTKFRPVQTVKIGMAKIKY